MKNYRFATYIFLGALMLASCSGAKKQLGLERTPPDEFAVVKRAPLAMPPGYELRPPQPGAPRPQEQTPNEQARQVVFGAAKAEPIKTITDSETLLLQQAGADIAQPEIREIVNEESANLVDKNKPVVEKLLNIGGDAEPPASVVDAKKEAQRLRENAAQGKPVTEGETPSKEK